MLLMSGLVRIFIFHQIGLRATVLLPLAVEYALSDLQHWCEMKILGMPSSTHQAEDNSTPILAMLTSAEKLDLSHLREKMIDRCARRMAIADLELQKESVDNKELKPETYTEVVL